MLKVTGMTSGYYKEKAILHNLSLEVHTGDFFALLGPNGSGKTTFVKSVLGVLPKMAGSILLNNRPLSSYTAIELAKETAVLSQEHSVGMDFTVEEIVRLGRYPHQGKGLFHQAHPEDDHIIQNCLEMTNVSQFRLASFASLSGGEKQRVLLAKALAQEPRLLFLDEPTNHLDIKYTIEILNLLQKLQRETGLTVIAILHDLNVAALYANRCALLKGGQLIAEGDIDMLRNIELLEEVYDVKLLSYPHPVNGKPQVFFVPDEGYKVKQAKQIPFPR